METEHEEIRRDGFFFDVQSFRLDLYRLLCCFYASEDFARKRGRLDITELVELHGQFEEFEVMRLLVNIAATVRVVADRERAFFRKLKLDCGQLTPDLTKPRTREALTLREACNKILHATKFNFDTRTLRVRDEGYVSKQTVLRPYVHLYGTKDRLNWKASLNVEHFVQFNARVVQG